jgi:hypothetical protein
VARLALILLIVGLVGCSSYSGDIAAVRQSTSPTGMTNEDFVRQIAGARGQFDWSAGIADRYKANDAIVLVSATIQRIGRSGAKHQVVLEYIHNRQTGMVDLDRVLIDGKPQDIVGAALNFLMMQLD